MKEETFDRISGLTSIKDTNIFRNNYAYFADIIDQFGKTLELPPGLIFE